VVLFGRRCSCRWAGQAMNNILSYSVSPLVQHMFPERQNLLGAPRYLPAHYRQNPADVSGFSAVVFVVPLPNGRNRSAQIERLEDYFSVPLDCTREVDFSVGAQIVVVCARRAGVLERWDTGQAPVAAKVTARW